MLGGVVLGGVVLGSVAWAAGATFLCATLPVPVRALAGRCPVQARLFVQRGPQTRQLRAQQIEPAASHRGHLLLVQSA
jgi:hypothetical protein